MRSKPSKSFFLTIWVVNVFKKIQKNVSAFKESLKSIEFKRLEMLSLNTIPRFIAEMREAMNLGFFILGRESR